VLVQTQWTHVQRLSPENKVVSPYIPLQAGYKNKKQSSTHIWLYVTPLAISFSQCYVTFMFQFFRFYLSALLSSPPVSPACLFFFWPLLSCYRLTTGIWSVFSRITPHLSWFCLGEPFILTHNALQC
jgi:hypothetical protein